MGEYIKKEDLMAKVVTETLSDYTEDDVIYVDVINQLPTYSFPDREKGEWVLGGYDDLYWVCDKCGYKMHEYYHKPTEHFCPNCGADMRGEIWNGMHGQVIAPKGTFEKLFNDIDDEDIDI